MIFSVSGVIERMQCPQLRMNLIFHSTSDSVTNLCYFHFPIMAGNFLYELCLIVLMENCGWDQESSVIV